MKTKVLIIFLFIVIINIIACGNNTEKRKIKLSDESVSSTPDQQLTSTIRLEPQKRLSIAVMFFQNLTGDSNLQWLQKGLTEMFIRALSQSRHLSVLSTDRLLEILDRLGKSTSPEDIDFNMASVVAKEANVKAMLLGDITKSGNSLKINIRLHEPNRGVLLREESIEGPGLEHIFMMVDDLTQKIKNDLQLTLEKSEPSRGIAELTTNSLKAWQSYTRGVELVNMYLHADAIPPFEEAIALDSTFILAYINLCQTYFRTGDVTQASTILKKLQTLRDMATQQEQYQIDRLEAHLAGDPYAYIAATQKWLQEYPDDRDASFALAELYHNWHNYYQAKFYYENVLEIDPKHKVTYNKLGYIYANIGDFSKAISLLNKYKALAADEPNPYDSLGEIYLLFGEFEDAEKHFKQALKINKDFLHSQEYLAHVYFHRGDYTQALKAYKELLEKMPDGAPKTGTHSMIANTYWRLGEKEKAIASYQKAIELSPFNFWAIERLYDIYSENNEGVRAHEMLLKSYDRFKKSLKSDISNKGAIEGLLVLSILYGININETIDILKDKIASYADRTLTKGDKLAQSNMKLNLTLLYLQTNQRAEIKKLWQGQEIIPAELWSIFKEVHDLNYSGTWKGFSILNRAYYEDIDAGIAFYEPMISYAIDHKAKNLEMLFRLFLADLHFHTGDLENARHQLRIAGMPEEESWLVIGPFDNQNGFNRKFPPEKEIKLEKIYKDDSQSMIWQHAVDGINDGFINFKHIYERSNWAVAYGLLYTLSPENREVQFRIGTDDGSKVWLNDKEIWKLNKSGPAILDDVIIRVNLKKGVNKILIKVCNTGAGDWGFFFRITDGEGNGVPDVQFVSADANVL